MDIDSVKIRSIRVLVIPSISILKGTNRKSEEVFFDALSTIITSYDEYRDDRPVGHLLRSKVPRRQMRVRAEGEGGGRDKGGPEGLLVRTEYTVADFSYNAI